MMRRRQPYRGSYASNERFYFSFKPLVNFSYVCSAADLMFGHFYLAGNVMGAVEKMMRNSGAEDILIETV